MGSFAGTCEIVEEKDELSVRTYQPKLGLDRDLQHPVLKLGYKGSMEDDIDKLFQSIGVKTSSTIMGPSNQVGASTSASTSRSTSPLRRNALMKKPMTVGTPRSPRVGTSEPASLKQALRDLCISKASEMAAQKRLSKSTASPRISEAERIKSLYNHVLVESPNRSGLRVDKGKGSMGEISLAPEDSKAISSENMLQQLHVPEAESSSQIIQTSRSGVPEAQINDEITPQQNGQDSTSSRKVENLMPKFEMLEISNTPASHPSIEEVIELDKSVISSNKSVTKPAAPKSGQKGRLHDAPSPGSINSQRVGKLTRNVPRAKPVRNKISLKKKIKLASASASFSANKFDESDQCFEPTTNQLFCQRCHCALKNASIETNHSLYASPNLEVGSGSVNSGVKSGCKEANQDSLASPYVYHSAEVGSGRKNYGVQNANKEVNSDSFASPVVSLTTEAGLGVLNSVIRKENAATNNRNRNGAIVQKERENPTSSEKGEFSQSSKDSLGEYSSTTSMSEESNLSRFSCGYKPHMSKDVRWEAIKHVKMQHGVLGLRHFNLLKKLGCGDIGTVYLAELIGTNCLFAIKVMDNEFLARRKKMPRAQAERDILRMLDHPFLPTLYTQFTSDNLSCLVMEYCPGGDLHVLRQRQLGRCFPEPGARFYVAEVLLALEYLHMLGVIYRDLKPENILVREDGHIMLTDFDLSLRCSVNPTLLRSSSPPSKDPARISGPHHSSNCIEPLCIEPSCRVPCFSPRLSSSAAAKAKTRKLKKPDLLSQQFRSLPQLVAEPTDARSNSFVGTHEYLAPEIIKGGGHGAAVDWWTFGVLLYELLYGRTPFKGCNNDETLANVLLQSLKFPDSPLVSFQARDLIRGLLVKEPENRLGSEKGAAEIKRHPFFEGLNWALIRCAIPPELPDCYDFGVSEVVSPDKSRYLECKAIGEHLEFELF